MEWNGSISLNNGSKLERKLCDSVVIQELTRLDVTLSNRDGQGPIALPKVAALRFLSIVETCRIPLCITLGSPYSVSTSSAGTERWFSDLLLNHGNQDGGDCMPSWWKAARPDSPLGILVAVDNANAKSDCSQPSVTELLFYASICHDKNPGPLLTPPPLSPQPGDATEELRHGPSLSLNALALSSDLLHGAQKSERTPPTSPLPEQGDFEAVFLPPSFSAEAEIINEPPVRKRKSASDVFDEANERRKKTRRKGGEGVAAAAAPKSDLQMPSLKHCRSASISQPVPLQTRPLSRSPSISSSRPPTAAASAPKPSTLSRVQSAAGQSGAPSTESGNKDFISRIAMAGMRLYGLAQSKKRNRSRASSAVPSPAVDASFEELEAERKNDEEYKLIYHQVFKGTCFAFRAGIDQASLLPCSERVRDVVDQLLSIFCTDPMAQGLGSLADKLTPGGRKGFAAGWTEQHKSPFLTAGETKPTASSGKLRAPLLAN